jgi:transcriptional regulator with XRE-family HTH domain
MEHAINAERDLLLERFSARLRSAREAMHPPVTQRDVATRLGVSYSAVNLWEQGKAFPKIQFLGDISKWFSISVDWLIGVDKAPRKDVPINTGAHRINTVPVVASLSLNRWSWEASLGAVWTQVAYPEGTAAAFVCTSDSLSSVILPGDYAVVSKAHHPEPGSIVLVAIGRASEPVLRRYVQEGGDSLLVADDTRFPTHRLEDGARIIGKLVETVHSTVLP